MIISASRRTDIPAFYAEWMRNRVEAGYCAVPNPFNRNQVSRISLRAEDVDTIVFWTRNPRPLMAHLDAINDRGLRYYFQFTILGYPRELDPKSPPVESAVETFRELSGRLGAARVIWRYDPVILTPLTSTAFHRERYRFLAEALRGYTHRSVISLVDMYQKAARRMKALAGTKAAPLPWPEGEMHSLFAELAGIARTNEMEIVSCAEEIDLAECGIRPGKCIDDEVIRKAFGKEVITKKDPVQRASCGCVVSRDIGMYDSCLYGCQYCYATMSFAHARTNFDSHDPGSPSLIGRYEAPDPEVTQLPLFK